jgi:hypothetical protein
VKKPDSKPKNGKRGDVNASRRRRMRSGIKRKQKKTQENSM